MGLQPRGYLVSGWWIFSNSHIFAGKPVAVTHSKGRGATLDPQSDLGLEQREWERKRNQGIKSKKQTSGSCTMDKGCGILIYLKFSCCSFFTFCFCILVCIHTVCSTGIMTNPVHTARFAVCLLVVCSQFGGNVWSVLVEEIPILNCMYPYMDSKDVFHKEILGMLI